MLDVKPKFGAKSIEFKALYRNGFVLPYGDSFDHLMNTLERFVEQVRTSVKTPYYYKDHRQLVKQPSQQN